MILYQQESYLIMGACFEVYRELGAGFVEAVYHEALEIEFVRRSIPFQSKLELAVFYKGHRLAKTFQPDFVCFDKIIIELKAARELCDDHRAQIHNYLRATGFKLGLLLNYGHAHQLESERIAK